MRFPAPSAAAVRAAFPVGFHSLHRDDALNYQMNRLWNWVGEQQIKTQRTSRKNARMWSARSSGSSNAAKCPPRGISVQR